MNNEDESNIYHINTAFNQNRIEMTEQFRGEPLVKQVVELRERAVKEALIRLGWTPPLKDNQIPPEVLVQAANTYAGIVWAVGTPVSDKCMEGLEAAIKVAMAGIADAQ